jgi:ribA/ribD-fused uncharacterized protein
MIRNFKSYETRFLSNFMRAPFTLDGFWYSTVEHYYQSQKTLDLYEGLAIREASSPTEARTLGSKVTLRADWHEIKLDVMRNGVRAKFEQNPALRQRLIDTGDEELVEGNHWGDEYWGVNERTNHGENWLGRILMEVRKQLRGVR